MRNRLTLIALLVLLPVVSFAQQGLPFIDSARSNCVRGDWKPAIKWLKVGVKAGSKECMTALGDYYSCQERYKKAAKYYTMANNAEGDYGLGCLYLRGNLGCQSVLDMQRGLRWVRSAEQAGYRDAIFLLACMFDEGGLLEQSYDSAVVMLRRLPTDPYALFLLAGYYERGTGVRRDSLQAMEYYRRSGEAGLSDGYAIVGDYYRCGLAGMAPDSLLAYQNYMLAAGISDDNARGLFGVADCYLKGIGTRVDSAKAVYFLRDAVVAGSSRAAAELADIYYYGRAGIETNADTAQMLYQMARQTNLRKDVCKWQKALYEKKDRWDTIKRKKER